jgi:hypothetical protein
MVNTTNNLTDINPLERIDQLEEIGNEKRGTIAAKRKELEELEKNKKKEIEDLDQRKRRELDELERKKQKELGDLDKKRKELRDLEDVKIKEIEETQELIERSFQDLMRHKRELLREEDEEKAKKVIKDKESSSPTLEEVASTAQNIIPEGANANYSKFFEKLQEPQRLYDITNNQFYSGLTELRNKAAQGQITAEEEMLVERLRDRFEQFNSNQTYMEKDQNQYVKRSINIVEQIGNYQRLNRD